MNRNIPKIQRIKKRREPSKEINISTFRKKKAEEDWEFDFSVYAKDEEDDQVVEDIFDQLRPKISNLRSRFSLGAQEIARISDLKVECSRCAIKVEARSQDLRDYWELYAVLSEIWDITRNLHGRYINAQIEFLRKRCRSLFYEHTGKAITEQVVNNLLYLKMVIYYLLFKTNMSFETDVRRRGTYAKAKRSMVQ